MSPQGPSSDEDEDDGVALEHATDLGCIKKRPLASSAPKLEGQASPPPKSLTARSPMAPPPSFNGGAKKSHGVMGILGGVASVLPWIWKHFRQLHRNGTLLQAIGVPLRHMFAIYGATLCLRNQVSWRTYALAFVLWPLSGFGVTAGAHRLWTHQSYKPTAIMEALLIVLYSLADQGPISGWALTHALHHRASDTASDPHNREAGFWHSHFGWLFSSQSFHVSPEDYHRVMRGLGKMVLLHDRHNAWWDPCWSHCVPMFIAFRWSDAWAGFFVAGALRWMFVQHVTFFVNSVAHGERHEEDETTFDASATGIGPRVSLLVTVLALGEGWHDYHHIFPWDYAASELNFWDQWNPTKGFIDTCAFFGLCDDRRRCSTELQVARRLQMAGVDTSQEAKADGLAAYRIKGWPFLRYRVPVPGSIAATGPGACKGARAFDSDPSLPRKTERL
eukprot:TRINITY_DN33537_c0_g1_i1.p1 TRINITY_DN33537_c0_g1~~TRINITY_DN33537_c0_g1_i1.p1  ORF type:complete len:447 (+),score=53.26 TRINITY_DN33537_c0_g1_i1:68-1408(+)